MKKEDRFICSYNKNNRCVKGKTCGIFCDKYAKCRHCKNETFYSGMCINCKWKDNNPHI